MDGTNTLEDGEPSNHHPAHNAGAPGDTADGPKHAQSPSMDGPSHHHHHHHHHHSGRFPRISLPVELMQDSYDVVVIGSGYGGGVAASRMARGRQRVCVLERGRERAPGEFPEKLSDALKELHVSGEFAPGDRRGIPGRLVDEGNPNGLYHFMVGEGQNVYMGNGLGGTSLLNANVFLEAHPAVLNMEIWPNELRGRDAWRKYYDRARDVLEPVQYPVTSPDLKKADLLRKQAELMGWEDHFYRVPQTTRFSDGPNSTGVNMRQSTLTGMDATGINDGSKTTTLATYLSDAWNWGAEIFCDCEVRYITEAPGRGGYNVYFAWDGGKRRRFPNFYEDLMWVHSKKLVFLGAGSIGSTEILLRSREMGLEMSDDLGSEMSGNGDMLGFGYNTDFEANCMGRPDPLPNRPVGPCITSVLDLRDQRNPLDGFVIEDCAVPYALAPIMYSMLDNLPDEERSVYRPVEAVWKTATRLMSKLLGPYFPGGSVERTPAYLIMSHDSSQGRLTLRKDKAVLTYSGVGRSKSVSRIQQVLEKMTAAVGGDFVANPVWSLLGKQEITVHPIGGARISRDNTGNNGVVNHIGQVIKGNTSQVYPGLVVCDGSIVPAAVGVNPFATITALAERSVEYVARNYGIRIDYETKNGLLNLYGQPAFPFNREAQIDRLKRIMAVEAENHSAGIGFSEIMTGYLHVGPDVKDFERAATLGRSLGECARFFLTVKSWNTAELVHNNRHQANLTGTVSCSAMGGLLVVYRGIFQLFNQDPRQPDTTNLTYDFDMVSPSGRRLHFYGYKVVNTAAYLNPMELLRQTTTLYAVVTEDGKVMGRGMLHIAPDDFIKEVETFETTGFTWWDRTRSVTSFLTYFAQQLSIPFLSPLGKLEWPGVQIENRSRDTTPSATIPLTASDGVKTTMVMWNPFAFGKEEWVGAAPTILFIPGAAVDHTIFALPTIEKNAIEYFQEAGYRSYCLTHRTGRTAVAQDGYTPYDTRKDIYAALAHIRKAMSTLNPNEPPKIYVVAHCVGSLALCCGLLNGTIPGDWIQGITASMVFMNPMFGKVDNLVSRLPLSPVYSRLVGSYWDCTSSKNDSAIQKAFNQALRFYPAGDRRESCRSVVCHRSELVFGRLWTHKNLNEATHSQLERFLGGTSMRSLEWLTTAGQLGSVTANGPAYKPLDTPENIEHLRGIPILFLSGAQNMVFTAENTDVSYTTLCNAHGREWYEREVFAGRGHLDAWMGPSAHQDVYPRVRRHVDRIMKGV